MSVLDTLTGKSLRDAAKEAAEAREAKHKTQVDLDDAVKKATKAIDEMLAAKAAGGK